MDRNQIIGIVLILAMLVGYQLLVPKPAPEKKPEQITQTTKPKSASSAEAAINKAEQPLDSAAAKAQFGEFASAATGVARDIVVENKDLKVTFSTLGGRVKEVVLKNYKTFDQKLWSWLMSKPAGLFWNCRLIRGKSICINFITRQRLKIVP